MVDIHNAKERIEWSKKSITQRFSKNNAQISCRFLTRLRLENKSYGRVANYADCCIRILKLKDDQNIQDWTRDNIEHVHQLVADSDHANSVKKSTLTTLKRLYHFAIHNEIPDKSKGHEDFFIRLTSFYDMSKKEQKRITKRISLEALFDDDEEPKED